MMNSKFVKKYYLIDPKKYDELMKTREGQYPASNETASSSDHLQENEAFLHPSVKNVKKLDQDMKHILNDDFITDFEKMEQYNQKLSRYLKNFKTALATPTKKMLLQGNSDDSRKQLVNTSQVQEEIQKETLDSGLKTKNPGAITSTIPKTYKEKADKILKHLNDKGSKLSWDKSGSVYYKGKVIPNSNIESLINDAVRKRKIKSGDAYRTFSKVLKAEGVPTSLYSNAIERKEDSENSTFTSPQSTPRRRRKLPKVPQTSLQWEPIK